MDLEAGKDGYSYDESAVVVFTDIKCKVPCEFRDRFQKKKNVKDTSSLLILKGVNGALRSGRLTFILGPSGAGKSTLMNIMAGRKRTGVSGSMSGVGRGAVLVTQHATLIDTLTGRETLQFAASLKLPHSSHSDRQYAIENVAQQLGIQDALDTKSGYMSGGERKRLTVACELLTDPAVMLLDEPTSGLDSVSSMSVVRVLRNLAQQGKTVACIVHQPASKLYSAADDVLLLAGGRTVYAGPTADAPALLQQAGFVCPQYYNMADFLLEVASGEHAGDLTVLENEARSFAYEVQKSAKSISIDKNGKAAAATEVEALLEGSTISETTTGYPASPGRQLKALLWRCFIGALRDLHLTQVRLAAHILVALLLGSLYHGAGDSAERVTTNTSCLFFFLLFLFFSNAMPTIHTFPAEAAVVLQEHLNKWYSLPAYCFSKIIADFPIQIICASAFIIPAWMLTSQPLDVDRFSLVWLTCILVTILAQTFGIVIGAACGVKLGMFVVPAANIPMLMFSEFFIPYNEMPIYLRPLASISYFRYSFDALIHAVYGFDRPTLPCHEVFCYFRYPHKYIEYLGLTMNIQTDLIALIIWIVFLQISFVCVLKFKVHRACA